jgi:hypothetical protein
MATIRAFPISQVLRPAQQRPDDGDHILDRPIFFEEPLMQCLVSSPVEYIREFAKVNLKLDSNMRSGLPFFPANFRMWEYQTSGTSAVAVRWYCPC